MSTPIVWYFVVCYGFMLLMSSGFPAQEVTMMVSRGISADNALKVLMISAIAGVIGSICTGFIDDKLGAKRTTIIMNLAFLICLSALALSTNATLTIILIFVMTFFLGGCFNMCPSLAITIFGAAEYNSVNRFIHPLTQIIKACSFITVGLSANIAEGAVGTMWAFVICVVISTVFVLPIRPRREYLEEDRAQEAVTFKK